MSVDESALNIFTDGSSLGKPRAGGIGIRYVTIGEDGHELVEDGYFLGYPGATNNQMELQACIKALEYARNYSLVSGFDKVIIWTDALYVADHYLKAIFEWPNSKWRTRDGRPVLNAQHWKDLARLLKKFKQERVRVDIKWVKGHSKNPHNRAADRMARQSAKRPYSKPLTAVRLRRKLSSESVEIGSVEIAGQRMTIRIISCEYLRVHKLWKYTYEVMSRKSKYYGNVDVIFSDLSMDPGHIYYVKVNQLRENPLVEKVYREVDQKKKE